MYAGSNITSSLDFCNAVSFQSPCTGRARMYTYPTTCSQQFILKLCQFAPLGLKVEKQKYIRILCMTYLDLGMGEETMQIFSVQPSPKPRRKRIDYELYNYCATCGVKYSKIVLRCLDCNQRVRSTGWHRSNMADMKRV